MSDFLSVACEFSPLSNTACHVRCVARIHPPVHTEKRPPLSIVLALDTSSSMRGQKLDDAILSAISLVKALGPEDTFACIQFNRSTSLLVPATRITAAARDVVISQIRHAATGVGTDLLAAIVHSAAIANTMKSARVILLTDGQPSHGETSSQAILSSLVNVRGSSTFSAFGYGRDVDGLLLAKIADIGRGHYSFIESGETTLPAVGAELGGLLHTIASQVTLTIAPSQGVTVKQVLSLGEFRSDHDNHMIVELGDVHAGEVRPIVFELEFTPNANRDSLATVWVEGRTSTRKESLAAPVLLAPSYASQQGTIDQDAAREILIARAALALHEASESLDSSSPQSRIDRASSLAQFVRALRQEAWTHGLVLTTEACVALEAIEQASAELMNGSQRRAERAAQDMVAASRALIGKRESMFGGVRGRPASISPAQQAGMALVDNAARDAS